MAVQKHTSPYLNQPGVFTAIHGFEWTSMPGGNNLHRNLLFRDGADKVSQIIPMSLFDSEDPEDLWKYMRAYPNQFRTEPIVRLSVHHKQNIQRGGT